MGTSPHAPGSGRRWKLLIVAMLAASGAGLAQEASPPLRVRVGLVEGRELILEGARFGGFITTRDQDTVLYYRRPNFRGEISVQAVARIEIGYEHEEPFPLRIELRDGTELEAVSDRRRFLEVSGAADLGQVTIRHPDPLEPPPDAEPGSPDREDDLTIAYIEFLAD